MNIGAYHVPSGGAAAVTLTNTATGPAGYVETLQSNGFTGTGTNFTAAGSANSITGNGGSGAGSLVVGISPSAAPARRAARPRWPCSQTPSTVADWAQRTSATR